MKYRIEFFTRERGGRDHTAIIRRGGVAVGVGNGRNREEALRNARRETSYRRVRRAWR